MIDMVFVVDNPREWHQENIEMNPQHYSSLRYLGAKTIASIQEKMACGVYYNPYCNVNDRTVKYGVISTDSLENDLRRWNYIYIAGRLHKPVVDLQPPESPSLAKSLKKNRETALRAVLLQEGRYISKFSLYHGITELSYLGDTRMRLAENPEKTKNIVTPLIREFDRIYMPLLNEISPFAKLNEDGSMVVQDTTPPSRFKSLMSLPYPVQISLARQHCRDPRLFDIEDIMGELSYLPYLRQYIRNAIAEVVRGSSILQTVQGLFTAGIFRSTKYAIEKLKKRASKKSASSSSNRNTDQNMLPSPESKTANATTNTPESEHVKGGPPHKPV